MITLISGTANSKAQIWHLFTHGEYFQPQRALFKHWIQTGFLQKKKTTEEDQLSLSTFTFSFQAWLNNSFLHLATKPLLAEQK